MSLFLTPHHLSSAMKSSHKPCLLSLKKFKSNIRLLSTLISPNKERKAICKKSIVSLPSWNQYNCNPFHHNSKSMSSKSTAGRQDPLDYISGTTTHFGYESVSVNEKEGKVREVFDNVADNYDVMNDLMSAGLHRLWKDELLSLSCVESMASAIRSRVGTNNQRLDILDVAGGTGDIAFRFIDTMKSVERSLSSGIDDLSVTVCDINPEMLRVGERRARQRFGDSILDTTRALSFLEGNAQSLPFEENKFDLYTIAFGLRNVTDVDKALREAHRVLKPGGRYMCLEFANGYMGDNYPLLASLYDAYSFNVIPEIGHYVANDRSSYQYLVESIRKFSTPDELVTRLKMAGFVGCKYTTMTGGIVAIHQGWKPLK
mmetsp:Transcript_13344/g.19081  ORF Transcript_13344/g.19081 Transcript_13344/m.19081 type:complete len:373 (+) Transcript_13344:81-1199(+)